MMKAMQGNSFVNHSFLLTLIIIIVNQQFIAKERLFKLDISVLDNTPRTDSLRVSLVCKERNIMIVLINRRRTH